MLDYIANDLERARIATGDSEIGGMVVCDSAPQAKKMNDIFQEKYADSKIGLQTINEASELLNSSFTTRGIKKPEKTGCGISNVERSICYSFITCFLQASMPNA